MSYDDVFDELVIRNMSDLKRLRQWVGYTTEKVPMCPANGRAASSTNPATWGTATEAWAAKKRHHWAGIGFVFTIDAGVVGVDLDDCFDDNGQLSDMAQQVISALDSYTEISPSGKGIHIFARGTIPHSIKQPGFEMYNEMRYFTVTGNRVAGTTDAIEARNDVLNALFVTFGGDMEPKPEPVKRDGSKLPADEQEVRRALGFLPKTGDYNTHWLRALLAVHDAFPDERGVALIEEWSPGYRGEVARKFRSFDRSAKEGITIATLFHMAKEHGYQPPAKPLNKRLTATEKMSILARA